MKKDRLKFKSDIEKEFANESIRNINFAIFISKIIRFLYTDSTIFTFSLIPTIIGFFYISGDAQSKAEFLFACLLLIIGHFFIYKYIIKNYLFKESEETFEEFDLTIKTLEELKIKKKSKNL